MPNQTVNVGTFNIRDINPLEHLTADLSKARFNYQSILNALVEWNSSKLKTVTARLMCDTDPGFVDYTFPTRNLVEGRGVNGADPDSGEGAFSYGLRYPVGAMISGDPYYNDKLDIRANVVESAGSSWKLFATAVMYPEKYIEEVLSVTQGNLSVNSESEGSILGNVGVAATTDYVKGQFICIEYPNGYHRVRWVKSPIASNDTIVLDPAATESNTEAVFEKWSINRTTGYMNQDTEKYLFVIHAGKVYRPTGTLGHSAPGNSGSGWEYFCDVFGTREGGTVSLKHGRAYLYDPAIGQTGYANDFTCAELFIYTGSDTQYGYPPYEIDSNGDRRYNDGWSAEPVLPIQVSPAFSKTSAIRWTATTDIDSIMLYRVGAGYPDQTPEVYVLPNVRIVGAPTGENGGVAILDTSNYAEWPGTTAKWSSGHNYKTDPAKGASELQDYTAIMVFDHANPDCKQCNIVNYDGPDLDQGLAVHLPVESTYDGKLVYPRDGQTFEFLFRIWPNPAYNGHETADLIINKAQIYVYSVPRRSNLACRGTPIAKFSMARLTNFYVFAENIAVPNRPVLVKAKFVYSEEDKSWKQYGYYQLPDCIFLSPGGFVDPSDRSSNTYGVETAGFPLVQDPFSTYDMSPVLVDDEYRNRIG